MRKDIDGISLWLDNADLIGAWIDVLLDEADRNLKNYYGLNRQEREAAKHRAKEYIITDILVGKVDDEDIKRILKKIIGDVKYPGSIVNKPEVVVRGVSLASFIRNGMKIC